MVKKITFIILLSFFLHPPCTQAKESLWQISSIDTMKYSRDASRNPVVKKIIPVHVKAVADSGASYIAIDTPYDDEFLPTLKLWVDESRKYNLKVWFRGNFSGWEGWFGYPKLTSSSEHITKTFRFITQNPTLFEDGDIFTPAPEAENGILGDPRQSRKIAEFNQFLINSYDNCSKAFGLINKQVNCGVWSLNTDVARDTVSKETIKKLGGVISIDHYTKTPEKLIEDVKALHKMFDAQVVLGEFGAPIPDINGSMTEIQQADYVQKVLQYSFENKDIIQGLNYWVIAGGSTTLLNDDNSPRRVYFELQKYYQPAVISGNMKNTLSESLSSVKIEAIDQNVTATTDKDGNFKLVLPAKMVKLRFSRSDLKTIEQTATVSATNLSLIMEPSNPDFWYRLRIWLYSWLKR